MPTRFISLLFGVAAVLLTACGCDAVGYPAIDGVVQDRVTGRPVALGGATLRYGNERQPVVERIVPDTDTTSRIWICCTPGLWRVRIDKPGYVPFDSTVRVRDSGRCDRPVLLRFLARLQPLPGAVTRSGRSREGDDVGAAL